MYFERTIEPENIVFNETDKIIILTNDKLFEVYQLQDENKRKLIGIYYTQEQAFEKVTDKKESKKETSNSSNRLNSLFNKYKIN